MAYRVRIVISPMGNPWASHVAGLPWVNLTLLIAGSVITLSLLLIPKIYIAAAVIGVIASLGIIFLVATAMHARVNGVLLTWLLISPLAYYFLSFPREKPIFTFDRFVIGMITVAILLVDPPDAFPVPAAMKRAALAWAVFIAFAFTSLIGVWSDLGLAGSRLITEAFIFPGLMALFVLRVFPAGRYIRTMHTLIGLMTIYSAAIGIVELVTNTDVLPIPSAIFYGAEETGSFARVNGPFATNVALAMVGAIAMLLLFFLRRVMNGPISRWRASFHWVAISAAMTMALLPQFRALVLALVIVLLLELYRNRRIGAWIVGIAVVLLSALALMSLPSVAPAFFESRVADPSNFYGRIAQQYQTWELFREHPWNGVGFANFMQAIQGVSSTSFRDVESLNTAHNSLGSVLAETGIAGCLPFIAANTLWFLAFFRLQKIGRPLASAAYRFFLYTFICYWIMALTLTSCYERDLNLWYMFACAIMYKLALVGGNDSQYDRRTVARARP